MFEKLEREELERIKEEDLDAMQQMYDEGVENGTIQPI